MFYFTVLSDKTFVHFIYMYYMVVHIYTKYGVDQ